MNKTLAIALEYLEKHNFSVFPANPAVKKEDGAKSPLIKEVIPYRTRKPTREEVISWWTKYPNAMIAGITGKQSNLIVLDADTQEAIDKINELAPDSLEIPSVNTPNGGKHFYFQYNKGLPNYSKGIIHIRTEGAYIILPGSTRADGKSYILNNGCSIEERPMLHNNIYTYLLSFSLYARGTSNLTEIVTDSHIFFGELRKDEDLFHAANIMTKGGAEPQFMYEVLERLILSWGESTDEKWIKTKIKSAMDRLERKERNIADEIREWVLVTSGHFSVTDSHRELGLVTPSHRHAANVAFRRLEKDEHLIEKYGDKRGNYRLIDRTLEIQDWKKAKGKPLNLEFPLDVSRFVRIFPGNIILLEGQKSQGKSAFAIEFCRLNRKLFKEKILYQNVEMSDDEFLERFESYGDIMTSEEWDKSMTIIRQTNSWWDKILPDGLNIIDYLVEYKEAFLIAEFIFKIHQKLKNGIALILVQRDPFKPYPAGGRGVRDIPRLILSLIHHKIKIEDVKSFKKTELGNPTGLIRKYKQASWWNFIGEGDWYKEKEEKYKDFLKGGQP